jgi:small-conductance mechanosensitive channel
MWVGMYCQSWIKATVIAKHIDHEDRMTTIFWLRSLRLIVFLLAFVIAAALLNMNVEFISKAVAPLSASFGRLSINQ